jgi:hypothetical protein
VYEESLGLCWPDKLYERAIIRSAELDEAHDIVHEHADVLDVDLLTIDDMVAS